MKTIVLPPDAEGIARAVELLADGEVVALPTETVYGLAGDAANPAAAAAIFQAKERPFFDPLIVHLPDATWLDRLVECADGPRRRVVARLTETFWPGPLTIILPRREGAVPDLVTAGSPLVAVRISAHPVFRAVVGRLGRPLAAPSANRFGRISPTCGEDVRQELDGRIPLILEAGRTAHGLESTIVRPDEEGVITILRHGPVTAEALRALGLRVSGGAAPDQEKGAAVTPGSLPGHYAPRTPLRMLEGAYAPGTGGMTKPNETKVGLLSFRRVPPGYAGLAAVECLSETGDLKEAATRLFAALRRLDAAGLEVILAEPVPAMGLGVAIMERLGRAAAGSAR